MSQISMKPEPQLQEVELTSLNLQQLTALKEQLDQDLGVLQNSLHTLKIAQNRFQESAACLTKLTDANNIEGNEVMVPLTGSMYVTGKLVDTNNILVDIGTGYYVSKSMEAGKDYFTRRVEYITEQMEKIQQIGMEKSKMRDATMEVMEKKIQSQVQKELTERA
ncbi:hypothetical protein DMN91_001045 [Ooceraea biroi]|uniref:Prefoldin subunit n=1 Tax=Ooceraea biroi TaxID=2015173 RepID=A0A026WHE6_OOCBI|nr:prefoldin subunit 5 [Ooceraea biroi]EZA55450.1 Prefoldin subunit [Ooceraea biroi]RLU27244.1 hypothetical protein DMN91_001045 [Ooceraea biroi]